MKTSSQSEALAIVPPCAIVPGHEVCLALLHE